MRKVKTAIVFAGILVVGAYVLYRNPHFIRAQTGQNSSTPCCGEPDTTAPREIDFPYYSLRDGFNSTLLLVSDSPKPMDLTVAVRSMTGQTVFAPMSIQPQEKLAVELRTLLTQLSADANGGFAEGSISVYFKGTVMPLAGQLTMTNAALGLIHESEMVQNDPGHSDIPPRAKRPVVESGRGPGRKNHGFEHQRGRSDRGRVPGLSRQAPGEFPADVHGA